jgi:hypothetical protein
MKRILASIPLLVLGAACGDDGDTVCTGHLCGEPAAITDPEGGNILFEYIYFDTELSTALAGGAKTVNRVIAYFMNSQTPEANPFPTPGKCFNFDANKGWPMFVGTPHEDLDIGDLTITGKNAADADVTIAVPKKPKGLDNIGRPHDIFYEIIQTDANKYLKFNSSYTVNFSGNGVVPATSMKDAIFLSADFTVKNPDLENNGPMKAGVDFPVEWNPVESSNLPMGSEVLGITWLVDSKGSPTHMCPVAHSAGQFTIPGATIAEYKQVAQARGADPTKVILLRNAVVHRLQRLPNGDEKNARRIDMLSVNCWAQLMSCM